VKPKVSFSHETGGPSHLPPYDPIPVINYYAEVEYANELARRRVVIPPPAPPPDLGEELPHNTIVSLPKINKLVYSKSDRERERNQRIFLYSPELVFPNFERLASL
jgi:hypothetical protein